MMKSISSYSNEPNWNLKPWTQPILIPLFLLFMLILQCFNDFSIPLCLNQSSLDIHSLYILSFTHVFFKISFPPTLNKKRETESKEKRIIFLFHF
jgi:hypothetical protein